MPNNADIEELVPQHLGIILDGNRRWAKAHKLPKLEGHRRGYENLKTIAEAALDRGVKYFSAYIFSTENWERATDEVEYLINKLFWLAIAEVEDLNRRGIRVKFAGSKKGLNEQAIEAMHKAELKTANNTQGTLVLCFNYGGQQEIVDAVKSIARLAVGPEDITSELIEQHLYVPDVPPLDLIIRTSGEQRISNFMLWRSAYSEIMFVDLLWPDFDETALDECLANYSKRQRRFGR